MRHLRTRAGLLTSLTATAQRSKQAQTQREQSTASTTGDVSAVLMRRPMPGQLVEAGWLLRLRTETWWGWRVPLVGRHDNKQHRAVTQ